MKLSPLKTWLLGLTSALALVLVFNVGSALAQTPAPAPAPTPTPSDDIAGLDAVGETTGLGNRDIREIAAILVNIFLGILGILAVCLLVYGGFIWMTAGGDEKKVARAKRLIIQAVIGLLIIFAAWGIATFILRAILDSTGAKPGTTTGDGGGGGPGLGGGSSTIFQVTSHQPVGQVTIRNVVPQITFSRILDAATINNSNVTFTYTSSGQVIDGTLSINANRISFTPSTPCPDPNADRFCFDSFAEVSVKVGTDLKSTTGTIINCSNNLCNSSFTTGDLVDTENPQAEMTLPDAFAGVPSDSLVDVQVHGTDDAGIAIADFYVSDTWFDTVPAPAVNPTDALIDALWDTVGLINGQRYEVSATVTDYAGNTDNDGVTVNMRPASCFNGVIDGIETGPDCGGDSASPDYCGACDGTSCIDDNDCSSGNCQAGICVSLPEITGVSPLDGAPGTYVTISGTNFGTLDGSVAFNGASGLVTAPLITCGDPWSSTQVIVEVPVGAIDGSITLTTAAGLIDSTSDANGGIYNFDVNTILHPGLCSLSPNTGAPTDAFTVVGNGLGASQNTNTINFDSTQVGSYISWDDQAVTATVPSVSDDVYDVSATVNGVKSNTLEFLVESSFEATPSIVSITPNSGGVGQYVTITGSGFGSSVGTVWFENQATGERALGSTSFPSECSDGFWTENQIIVIVPDSFTDGGGNLLLGGYSLSLTTAGGTDSNSVTFTVTGDNPTPGLCSIEPPNGLAGDAISLFGDNFGNSTGVVNFFPGASAPVTTWDDGVVAATVPVGAVTGPVSVSNSDGEPSNPINFSVSADGGITATGAQASYVWSFSSGQIPLTPQVIFECSDTGLSGVPNDDFTTGGVCVNSAVFAEFTTDMNQSTLLSGVSLGQCTAGGNDPCSTTTPVSGTPTATTTSIRFEPSTNLLPATLYQVTLAETITSIDGVPMNGPVTWTFTTSADTTDCRVEKVFVSPDEATITELNGTRDFTSLAATGCMVLTGNNTIWNWSVDPSVARINTTANPLCPGGNSTCALAEALAEGETPVTATETISGKSGEGLLTVNFTDPYVINVWPSCTEACVNAEVGASFNTAMDPASVEQTGAISLYSCTNELCTSLTPIASARATCTFDSGNSCTGFQFSGLSLTPSAFYRVIVSGDVESLSGVALTRTNYGGDYSWTFRVREDASLCAIDRISLAPDETVLEQIGQTQTFTGEAFGEADSCSSSGQRLTGFTYNWSWTDPIEDEDLDNNSVTRVAAWNKPGGSLVDTDPSNIVQGCTSLCTPAGSLPQIAICGDGRLTWGEECEDSNVANGDGCSANCLREGSTTTCGNGVVNRTPATSAGEDCDDGNTLNGDGCSSICQAEGASAVGATCGNNDVAVTSASSLAGEECDDGNAQRGDGCSNECLWEGSPTLAEIGGAICGDGGVDRPAEECDDNNVADGDGCSSSCVWEGSPTTCGLNGIDFGEACDDGNSLNGDGCSSKCLLEGSSSTYSSPSFCGDGLVGPGEYAACEVGAGGDGNIDPIQVAKITNNAVYEVDPNTKLATATIEVSETSSGLSTTASLGLSCTAEFDNQCLNPTQFGVGTGGCCMERPTVTLFPNSPNICRNSALYGIFTQEMDLSSFTYTETSNGSTVNKYRMYARLDLSGGAVCPSDHTTLAVEPHNFLARLWNKVVRLLTGRPVQADTGDCVAPITGYSETALSDGTFKVNLLTNVLLAANGRYTLIVEGDNALNDNVVSGVTSKFGVGMNGSDAQTFTVSSQICALDSVEVTDTDVITPYVFTQTAEEHRFLATPRSFAAGTPQEIQPISGVYSWDWTDWSDQNNGEIIEVTQVSNQPDTAQVVAAGENGTDAVSATATITDNTPAVPGATTITGSAEVTAFLCENPWPTYDQIPWSDNPAGQDVGAQQSAVGWTNFSTMYCRDAGEDGPDEDLPEVVVVRPPESESQGVIKEYLFEVAGTPDAIGVRIVSNLAYQSPIGWYKSQGFTGSPSKTEVAGFGAAQDGRTSYIVAPNQAQDGKIYSNVYVISYNDGASAETRNIYDQMVTNLQFAINVSDVDVCSGEDCSSPRDKLRRDTRRLTDITDIRQEIIDYKAENDSLVPALDSGTFIRGISSSVWDSWNSVLGGALGTNDLPVDPLNEYAQCGDVGTQFEDFNADTCINEAAGTYMCPAGSHSYHYKTIGPTAAYITARLEYDQGTWANGIERDPQDGVNIKVGSLTSTGQGFSPSDFCDNFQVYGNSTSCGDGVVGSSEVCEPGQMGGTVSACTTSAGLPGRRDQVCNANCSGFVDNQAAECVVSACGNGVVETTMGEQCDDGSLNGTYGFCGYNCSRTTSFYCGDGSLAGGESCDCGATPPVPGVSRAYNAGPGTCQQSNGAYSSSPNSGCAWDCSGPAPYCGDNVVNPGEVCDGTDQTWAGRLCISGLVNEPCTTNSECGGGVCGAATGSRAACPVGFTRVKACNDDVGASCTYIQNDWSLIGCTEIGTCGDGVVDPGEACDDGNEDDSDACTATCSVNVCGDGAVQAGIEQCDEGLDNGAGCTSAYGSTCTACSLSCRYEVLSGEFCGDGQINGTELCDATDIPFTYYNAFTTVDEWRTFGTCDPSQAGQLVTNSDNGLTYECTNVGVCNGIGPTNGNYCEFSSQCLGGTCVFPSCGQTCGTTCPFSYSSIPMQLLPNQPGATASESISLFSYSDDSTAVLPNAATIKVPACRAAAALTADISMDDVDLPTTYILFVTDLSYTMKFEVGGASLPDVNAGEKSRLEVAQDAIADAVEELYNELGDKAQIGAIGYRGLVAGECFYDSEDTCTPGTGEAECDLVGDYCNDNSSSLGSTAEAADGGDVLFGEQFGFVGPDGESDLIDHTYTYTYDPKNSAHQGHGTFTYEALAQAKIMFDVIKDSSLGDNARYITILLSDGEYIVDSEWADGTVSKNPIEIAKDFDAYLGELPDNANAGYEVYTAAITSRTDWQDNMTNWSSNNWDGYLSSYNALRANSLFNGTVYAYDGNSDTALAEMYDRIVDSITQIVVNVISSDGVTTKTTTATIDEGVNIQLPWPEKFECDAGAEQDLPIQLVFPGSGQISLENVRLDYCSP